MLKTSQLSIPALVLLNAISLIAVALAMTTPTFAQTDYGSITIVVDSGAPDIVITLLQGEVEVRKCKTKDNGTCVFAGLKPGIYQIQPPDPKNTIARSLMPGQNMTVEVSSKLAEEKSADVSASPSPTPALEVPDPRLVERIIPGRSGDRVTAKELQEVPNRNQNEVPLFEQQTGVVSTGVETFAGFIFNGQPGSQNVVRENGLSSNPIVLSSASFQDPNALFADIGDRQSVKAYDSFAIDTANTPSAFGTGTGTQLVKVVKQGKDKFAEVYEYFSNDAFGARNFFDFDRKPSLRFHLFGVNLSSPLKKDWLAFFNYEGIRASSGNTLFAAAPKLSLATNADPAVAGLIQSFRANGASIVQDASAADPNFDIIQLEAKNLAERNSVSTRLDFIPNKKNTFSLMYRGSRAKTNFPDGASGRRSISQESSHKAVFNYEHAFLTGEDGGTSINNQFIFGLINTPTRFYARSEGNTLLTSAINIGGEINQTGIAGQPLPLTVPTSGGLLGGDFKGRYLSFDPWQFSFVDQLNVGWKKHTLNFGGEIRVLRTSLDQLFGTTYNFKSLAEFLANRAAVGHSGDLGSLTGTIGPRQVSQTYYIGYLQHSWRIRENASLTSGVRYEYYTPLRELSESIVNVDPATGALVSSSNDLYKSRKTNFLPRVAFVWAPHWNTQHQPNTDLKYAPTVISASFGMHVGPDVFSNILGPITNNRLAVAGEGQAFPIDPVSLAAATRADDRQFKPLALSRDYTSPTRVYKFDFTIKRDLVPRDPPYDNPDIETDNNIIKELFVLFSYVGNRSHDLLLRNFANPIVSVQTNPDPSQDAIVRRQFDIEGEGRLLHPYGEFEFLTTGGRSSYDSFQASLKGHIGILDFFQVNYTLARDRGNTDGADASATGNPLDYNYDFGYNAADVRHQFNFTTVLSLPCLIPKACGRPDHPFLNKALAGWKFATIGTFQSGAPIDVRIDRPDVVYVDQAGNVFSKPAVGRTAVLNLPGGGSSVAAYRPNLVPGANPYLRNDRSYLDPAAFSIPAPGTLGNLPRGFLRGPGVRFVDFSLHKEILFGREPQTKSVTFNVDITNVFNHTNFKLSKANLPNKLGMDAAEHQLQPNQAFTGEAAPTFGVITRTFKRKSDLGASRQIQFGLAVKF